MFEDGKKTELRLNYLASPFKRFWIPFFYPRYKLNYCNYEFGYRYKCFCMYINELVYVCVCVYIYLL